MSDTFTVGPSRYQKIEGLRDLADFLDDHPHIEVPELRKIILHTPASVVEFLDGLDVVPVDEDDVWVGPSGTRYVDLVRRFAGLEVGFMTDAEHVGHTVEVPSTTVEFTPRRPDEIRAALAPIAEGAENGTAGTAPSANPERGAA